MIYESRPNVTVDAAAMALKTSNVVILKAEKLFTQEFRELVQAMRQGLKKSGFPEGALFCKPYRTRICYSVNETERIY